VPGAALSGGGPAAGCFGKVPALGDFLSRGLDPGLAARLDGWLQDAVAASRAALGEAWLDLYLASAVWRSILGAGASGGGAVAGILCPSVDRVGRCFPLAVLAPVGPAGTAADWNGWFDRAEDTVRDVVEERADAEAFLAALAALGAPPSLAQGAPVRRPAAPTLGPGALAGMVESSADGLWWSAGSETVAPSLDRKSVV